MTSDLIKDFCTKGEVCHTLSPREEGLEEIGLLLNKLYLNYI